MFRWLPAAALAALAGVGLLPRPAAAQTLDRVYVDPDRKEITLAARDAELQPVAAPVRYDVITDLTVFRGRLFAVASMDFDPDTSFYVPLAYSDGAQVLEYRPDTGAWEVVLDQEGSMLFHARAIGERLLLPEYFPFDDRSRRIHAYDGAEWDVLGLLPTESWHVMDVARYQDRLYASGSWRDEGEEARGGDPDWWAGYGHVFESADDGRTWRDIRRTAEKGRVLDLVEFRGRLWANERGMHAIAWDGKRWEEVPVRLPGLKTPVKLGNAHLAAFAGRLLAYQAELCYAYDGQAWSSFRPGFLDLWADPPTLYGLRADGHVWASADGVAWTKRTRTGVPPEELDRQAPKGRPLNRGAVARFRGRLFVGTAATGRIYAGAYETRGSWTSAPAEWAEGRDPTLQWGAAGDGVSAQWRSATSRLELTRAAWRKAAVSPAPLDLPAGHRWLQVRVELDGDGTRTPVAGVPRVE